MSVNIQASEEAVTAYISGEIDHHTAKGMREEIDNCLERMQPGILVLDFRDVSFMDSSGIGLVIGRYKLMQELGGEVRVAHPSAHIYKVMKLGKLDQLAVIEQ